MERLLLAAILLLCTVVSIVGITWGLPSRRIDPYLFPQGEPWSGRTIYELSQAAEKLSDNVAQLVYDEAVKLLGVPDGPHPDR